MRHRYCLTPSVLPPHPPRLRMWSSKNVKKSHRPSQVSSSTRADPNDSVSLPNGRDRRYVWFRSRTLLLLIKPWLCNFRRDPDDTGTSLQLFTENPPAQNFRTTPTQTRTFKRQPTRTTERDREKGSGEDRGAKYWQEQHRSVCVTPHAARACARLISLMLASPRIR